jgi:hypothetical protein
MTANVKKIHIPGTLSKKREKTQRLISFASQKYSRGRKPEKMHSMRDMHRSMPGQLYDGHYTP